jgi:hypothetical protein
VTEGRKDDRLPQECDQHRPLIAGMTKQAIGEFADRLEAGGFAVSRQDERGPSPRSSSAGARQSARPATTP